MMRILLPRRPSGRAAVPALLLALVMMLAACSTPRHRAPVESRANGSRPAATAPAPVAPQDGEPSPGSVEAGPSSTGMQPEAVEAGAGSYVVRPGDTLLRIALGHGRSWREIARWNQLDDPNRLEVGQVLRVTPPPDDEAASRATAESAQPAQPAAVPASPARGTAASAPVATQAAVPPAAADPVDAQDALRWQWPATGPVLRGFDGSGSKGVAIGGQAGDAVLAASDGRVVYAGSGLRGYGNLVIVKHDNIFLSAYAHNSRLLVKEDDPVLRGQQIAEMGSSDADRVQLHFEIRRQGRPVDPLQYLPPR
jgi:lipoprotein NlpD